MAASVEYPLARAYHSREGDLRFLPTSQLRTSMKCDDQIDCKEGNTLERRWERGRCVLIPYQEQPVRSLYGRSVAESLDLKWGHALLDEPEEFSGRVERSERVKEEYPHYLYGNYCPSETKSPARNKENATETMVSRFAEVSPFAEDSNSIHLATTTYGEPHFRDQQLHKTLLSRDRWCQDFESTHDTIMSDPEESSLSSLTSSPNSLPPIASLLGSPILSPKAIGRHSPVSGIHKFVQEQAKEGTGTRLPRNRRAAQGLRDLTSSEDDDFIILPLPGSNSPSSTSSGEYGAPIEPLPKPKKKASQAPIHHCKQCNINFTRNFDLQRHNQKHKSDTNEDISRRTCTNCGRVLSRVDAARRHVDTMPDSCNYIKKKESKPLLPVESREYYDLLQARYRKLADETKKPKGRKKAVVALPAISV